MELEGKGRMREWLTVWEEEESECEEGGKRWRLANWICITQNKKRKEMFQLSTQNRKEKKKKECLTGFTKKVTEVKDRWFWWSFFWLGKQNSFTLSLHEAFAISSSDDTISGSLRRGPASCSVFSRFWFHFRFWFWFLFDAMRVIITTFLVI